MIYGSFNKKLTDKIFHAMGVYKPLMFRKIGEMENPVGLLTKEHLRTVPENGTEPIPSGYEWGGEWMNLWVKGEVTVPEEGAGLPIYARPNATAREMLYFVDGIPKGLFNGGDHNAKPVSLKGVAGEKHQLAFEMYAGHFCPGCAPYDSYGYERGVSDRGSFRQVFRSIDLCVLDEDIRDLWLTVTNLIYIADTFDDRNYLKQKAVACLEKIYPDLLAYPAEHPYPVWHASAEKVVAVTRAFFRENGHGERSRGKIGLIGHSHMDTAWLWTVDETIRKCARTYSNALSLMEQYPEYKFVQSSALHSDWMRKYYPPIFAEMQKRVKEGRYEPNGGVFVECDCNITSGELMVRQFLKGQQFTRKYFNYTADCFWLPDTFGYNAAIPQIMLGCDVKYFYTTKISWNELNSFPLDTFYWKGIDGSRVFTHYNIIHRDPNFKEVYDVAMHQTKQPLVSDSKLLSYGFGDGGGGPDMLMVENARLLDVEGMPVTKTETVSDFMKELEQEAVNPPEYSGELYLELHRGTLTSMHDNKRNNRKCEFAMREFEYFNVLSQEPLCPQADELIKIMLLNQFHDILPGTCIEEVNIRTRREMTDLIAAYRTLTADYMAEITGKEENKRTLYNTLSFPRRDNAVLTDEAGIAEGYLNQHYRSVTGEDRLLIGGLEMEANSAKTVTLTEGKDSRGSRFSYQGDTLTTPFARIRFDENGIIRSFVDTQADRELVKKGSGLNVFLCGEDVPVFYDNWDVETHTEQRMIPQTRLLSRETVADGALVYVIRSEYAIGEESTLKQDMIFHADDPRVDFETVVDWKEKHTFFKTSFDLDLLASTVKNEIQFGHIDRPNHRSTSLDAAKFEVCNHKWTDISEGRYGAAILNDCKYGISALDGDLRLSLLKSGGRPDASHDNGVHTMTYSFLPHSGAFNTVNVIRPAYELNLPILSARGESLLPETPFFTIGAENVICEAVKPAEEKENAYVLRLYETERSRTKTTLNLTGSVSKVYETNMLEEIRTELPVQDGKVELEFHPFEIKTVLVER